VVCLPAAALASPAVSIFYYPWYGTPSSDGQYVHWSQNGHTPPLDIASSYYPARGVYSSSDPAVVSSQMAEMVAAGIDELVV
jgi:glycoprotein endo-alpha-1,2-mannosidase